MTVRAVLFDLDDTLMIDDAATDAAIVATAADGGCDGLDPAALPAALRAHARRLWRAGPVFPYCDALGVSATEGLWARFSGDDPALATLRSWAPVYCRQAWAQALAELGVDDPALGARMAERFPDQRRARHTPFPAAAALLAELRGHYRLALLTNGVPDLQWEKVQAVDLAGSFDAIVVSGDVGIGKPDRRVFALTLARLGIVSAAAPTAAVMVGNSLTRDIQGAHNAGLPGIWINLEGTPRGNPAIVPDAEITDLRELPAVLEHLAPRVTVGRPHRPTG